MDRRKLLGTLAAGTLGMGLVGRMPQEQQPAKPLPLEPLAEYKAKRFSAQAGLPGLSKAMLEEHLALYQGYVTRTNNLLKELLAAEKEGRTSVSVQETRRRLGFEFSGMRLHELYFEALRDQAATPGPNHPLQRAISATWGSHEAWWAAFKGTCTMPGIGWAALVQDPVTSRLMNVWFQDHENGIPVGSTPLLVIDVWEHAYIKDYGATARAKYVDALKPRLDWGVVESRWR